MPDAPRPGAERTIYTVSELNHAVRDLLEASFPLLWIEGEVSNLAQPRSGHWYFSLKDAQGQVRCAMFRNKNRLLGFTPDNGEQVLVRARIGLYAPRGDYQLIVEHLEAAGAGALARAFEQLKARLDAEGLFNDANKRPLPELPRRIGVITSATGAALRDVLNVLRRRFPTGRVLLHPVPVQGSAAAPAIARALDQAGRRCDVALLVRGGGSLEDLWAFNEETVARAIRACACPVVAGVGHETDVTIADFAADLRAPTPSAAAELVCPDQSRWPQQVDALARRLRAALAREQRAAGQRVAQLHQRLSRLHPQRQLHEHMQRLDATERRLARCLHWQQQARRARVTQLQTRLQAANPRHRLRARAEQLEALQARLRASVDARQRAAVHRWQVASRGLHAVSPLNTLERGYAIAATPGGQILTDAANAAPGDAIRLTLRHGRLDCEVRETGSQSGQSTG